MTDEEVRKRAAELLAELEQLDPLAISQRQRRVFKNAREQLQLAGDTGSETALHLGCYSFAEISASIDEVHKAKRIGAERARRRGNQDRGKV